jgi:kynureninase
VTAAISAVAAPAVAFLAAHYAPTGTRLQLLLGTPVDPAVDAAARALVIERGLDPLRRVATLRPRPGEDDLRTEDVQQYLERYGHEYSTGWFPAGSPLDRAALTATASRVGCTLGWAV